MQSVLREKALLVQWVKILFGQQMAEEGVGLEQQAGYSLIAATYLSPGLPLKAKTFAHIDNAHSQQFTELEPWAGNPFKRHQ